MLNYIRSKRKQIKSLNIIIDYSVFFAGNFIRNHDDTMECISYAFDYFSKNDYFAEVKFKAYLLRLSISGVKNSTF